VTSEGGRATRLPELDTVYWRPRVDQPRLRRCARLWTATTVAHTLPFIAAAGLLAALDPVTIPVAVILLAHAWIIPELYASRGAGVLRVKPASVSAAELRAVGLLGDLVGHEARDLHARTGLVLEAGRLGTWLIGEAGAVLVRRPAGEFSATASRCPIPSCPGAIASPISCSLCARTRPVLQRWQTSHSAVHAGGCADGCPGRRQRRSTTQWPPRGLRDIYNFVRRANARPVGGRHPQCHDPLSNIFESPTGRRASAPGTGVGLGSRPPIPPGSPASTGPSGSRRRRFARQASLR
jgi:hypothetical protein